MEVSEFETGVRQDLVMEKMREKVVSELDVTEEDAWKRFAADNRSVSFDYITVQAPESFLVDVRAGYRRGLQTLRRARLYLYRTYEDKRFFTPSST